MRSFCLAAAMVAIAAPAAADNLDALVAKHSAAYGVPEKLVRRVIHIESKGQPHLISKGNYGLMQIRLGTAKAMGYNGTAQGLLDADTNMTYAVKYLAGAYRVADGNQDRAIRMYQKGYYYDAKARGLSPYAVASQTSKPAKLTPQHAQNLAPNLAPEKVVEQIETPKPVERPVAEKPAVKPRVAAATVGANMPTENPAAYIQHAMAALEMPAVKPDKAVAVAKPVKVEKPVAVKIEKPVVAKVEKPAVVAKVEKPIAVAKVEPPAAAPAIKPVAAPVAKLEPAVAKIETPKFEPPKVEAPKIEAPKVEAPVTAFHPPLPPEKPLALLKSEKPAAPVAVSEKTVALLDKPAAAPAPVAAEQPLAALEPTDRTRHHRRAKAPQKPFNVLSYLAKWGAANAAPVRKVRQPRTVASTATTHRR